MSALGLGCVKTHVRGEAIEWAFLGFAIWVVRSILINRKKIILRVFELAAFSHSQGQKQTLRIDDERGLHGCY